MFLESFYHRGTENTEISPLNPLGVLGVSAMARNIVVHYRSAGLPGGTERLDEVDWPELKSSIRLTYTRNSTDNPFFPTSGANTTYSFDLAGGPLGS